MRAGRHWILLSRFFMIKDSWRGVPRSRDCPGWPACCPGSLQALTCVFSPSQQRIRRYRDHERQHAGCSRLLRHPTMYGSRGEDSEAQSRHIDVSSAGAQPLRSAHLHATVVDRQSFRIRTYRRFDAPPFPARRHARNARGELRMRFALDFPLCRDSPPHDRPPGNG